MHTYYIYTSNYPSFTNVIALPYRSVYLLTAMQNQQSHNQINKNEIHVIKPLMNTFKVATVNVVFLVYQCHYISKEMTNCQS